MHQSSADSISVLHVDDDPSFADLFAILLEREDDRITVESATSASEGLDRLAQHEYDCIVSDYEMPRMEGLAFLDAVREDYPALPFILFTGKGSEEIASDAISAGVTDYLQKGVGTEQYELLANRIDNAVAQYRTERQASEQERILSLIQDLNRALVQASTRREIEAAVTDVLTSAEPYLFAWMGEYDADRDQIIPRTVAGIDADSVAPTSGSVESAGDGAVIDATRTREITVARRRDPTLEVWADGTTPPDYRGAAVLPISYGTDRYGVVALYADEAEFVDAAERTMLGEVASDVAQAIHVAETRRNLERHQTAVEAVPEGVFILDDEAAIILINESAASLGDRTPAEVRGESFLTFVEEGIFDEAIVEWYLENVRAMLSSSTDRDEARHETEINLPSGESRTVEIHLTLRPYDEEYRGTVGIIRDVTERKRREREIEENKERYRRLVENAPIPIVLYDRDGDLVYVNDATVEFVGSADQEAVLGRPAVEFVHPADTETAADRMRRVIEGGEQAPATELTLVDRTGREKEAILSTVPVTYEDEPAGQVVIKDITEQKRRERALQRQRDRLDEFASIVSHDLRNPLNVATGWLESARAESDSEELERVARAHDRMHTLIDDLLAFARVGETAIDEEAVDLATLAETCWRNVRTAEATLVTDANGTIRADPSRVQQLLENLVRNSVEHGSTGGRANPDDSRECASVGDRSVAVDGDEHRPADVTVTVGDLVDGSGFYVADDGPGIPEEKREQVFDSGYSTVERGTGFGLAIVREIADAHGWTLDVTESESGGARFEISGVELER